LLLAKRAASRHSDLAELEELKNFVMTHPGRIEKLVRPSFAVKSNEDGETSTIQMPPFMRNSNAFPLSLAPWQYDLLIRWVKELTPTAKAAKALAKRLRPLSKQAKTRQDAVMKRLNKRRGAK